MPFRATIASIFGVAGLGAGLLLSGCATGQYSYIADSEASRRAEAQRAQEAAPDLILVAGNALLPGSRRSSGANPLPAAASAQTQPLAPPTLAVAGLNSQPLQIANGLLGAGPANSLSATTAVPLATTAASVSSASTAVLVNLTTIAQSGAGGDFGPPMVGPVVGPGPGPAPVTPPTLVSSVPGATPLTAVVNTLLATPGGLVPR